MDIKEKATMKYLSAMYLCLVLSFFVVSCEVGTEPIRFGEDQCDECKMTISDHRFGAEIVTKKGKIKKFDSVECLIDFVRDNGDQNLKFQMVVDYKNPKSLIEAQNAGYLISKKLPSPMGGFISAYQSTDLAKAQQKELAGAVYSWSNLKSLRIK